MNQIIYYVASSIDGFISGPNDDVSLFTAIGDGVDKYLSDLQKFKTVIMGRKTYEFGYKYGIEPGQPAYPHMEHFIFSDSMVLENLADSVHIEKMDLNRVQEIRENASTDVYLCGGGQFAGWLLDNGMIDVLKLKLNPILLGGGVRLFGTSETRVKWNLIKTEKYENGMQILTFTK